MRRARDRFDVAVIGAGPAGCEFAYRMASAGFSTVVFERDRLDREKPCGGGLQLQEILEFGMPPPRVVERRIRRMRLVTPGGRVLEVGGGARRTCSVTVRRSAYDGHLQERARAAGAVFLGETAVVGIRRSRGRTLVDARGRQGPVGLSVRLVAHAAGSASSRLTRLLGIPAGDGEMAVTSHCWLALEDVGGVFGDATEFYMLEALPDGYAWIFPKKDVVSVGVGASAGYVRRNRVDLRRVLADFIERHPVASRKLAGHQVVRRGGGGIRFGILPRLHAGAAVVLGDAAGFANTVHGGGIYHARKSALIASGHCISFLRTGDRAHLRRYDAEARGFFTEHETRWDRKIRRILWNPAIIERLAERGRADRDVREAILIVITSVESHEKACRLLEKKLLEVIYAALEEKAGLYRRVVDARLRGVFTGGAPLHRYANEILLNPQAKRLRACLGVLAAAMFGGDASDAVNYSLVYEVFHTASLVHDDVMDESPVRRGRPAVHARHGVANAILAGDLMLAKGYSLVARFSATRRISKEQLLAALAVVGETGEKCCLGQFLDMRMARERRRHTVGDYLEMIELKTGSLIEGAVMGGAVMTAATRPQRLAIGRMGRHLGMAFQVIDDSLDLLGESANKSVMHDLKQGKVTPMLVHALARAGAAERRTVLAALGNRELTPAAAARVTEIYRACGAVAMAQRLAHECIGRSREALRRLPPGAARDRFGEILDILDYWSLLSD